MSGFQTPIQKPDHVTTEISDIQMFTVFMEPFVSQNSMKPKHFGDFFLILELTAVPRGGDGEGQKWDFK